MPNVKSGDRAIIVSAPNEELARCIGHTVQVVKMASLTQMLVLDALSWECVAESDMLVQNLDIKRGEVTINEIPRGSTLCMGDEFLKPLRDEDGEDEMVRIAREKGLTTTLAPAVSKEREDATV